MTTKEQAQKDEKKYYIMLLIMIITGACNTIFLKLQNNFYKEVEGSEFQHPWFQSLQMFVGEIPPSCPSSGLAVLTLGFHSSWQPEGTYPEGPSES